MMIDGIPNRPIYFYQKDIIVTAPGTENIAQVQCSGRPKTQPTQPSAGWGWVYPDWTGWVETNPLINFALHEKLVGGLEHVLFSIS